MALSDYGTRLKRAQEAYGSAKTAAERAAAAAEGQRIRQEAAKAGYSASTVEKAAQSAWKSSSSGGSSSGGSGSKSSGGSGGGGGSSGGSRSGSSYSLPGYDAWSRLSHEQRVGELNKAGIDVGDWSKLSHEQRMGYLGGGGGNKSSGTGETVTGVTSGLSGTPTGEYAYGRPVVDVGDYYDVPGIGLVAKPKTSGQQAQQPAKEPAKEVQPVVNQPVSSGNQFPYEDLVRQILSLFPARPQITQEQAQAQAANLAKLQIDPVIQALNQAMQTIGQQASAQRSNIEADWTGVVDEFSRYQQEQERRALENAIARGGGRSGAPEWANVKIGTEVASQLGKMQRQKAAALTNLENQLGTKLQQLEQQKVLAEGQRGDMISALMQQIMDKGYASDMSQWQSVFNAAMALANMATQSDQWNQSFGAGLLPYFVMTAAQNANLPLNWSNVTGNIQAPISNLSEEQLNAFIKALGQIFRVFGGGR